ncbi:MAG: hypothetical protein ACLFV0_06900, partial [Nitriliruptoraceae bacterium]
MNEPVRQAQVYSLHEERLARTASTGSEARPRCTATTASGDPCRNYAVEGERCRVHARPTSAPERAAPRRAPGLAGPG